MTEKVPIYMHSATYAREHDELPEFIASHRAFVACRDAIDAAIREHYNNNSLSRDALHEVVAEFGYERIFYVLANTIQNKDWDARFSPDNKRWAASFTVLADIYALNPDKTINFIANSHPGLLNLFVRQAREEYALSQQLAQEPQMGMM